jgi:hypothetical protein
MPRKAVKGTTRAVDYGDGPGVSLAGVYGPTGSNKCDEIAAEYDRVFNAYVRSPPGSDAARRWFEILLRTPTI